MPQRVSSPVFSWIVMLLLAVACVGAAFWFGSQALEPVPVPPAPPAKSKVTFNPSVDVSKNQVFQRLEPLGPSVVEAGSLGRINPFVPLPPAASSTKPATTVPVTPTPTPEIPTSTVEVPSTPTPTP